MSRHRIFYIILYQRRMPFQSLFCLTCHIVNNGWAGPDRTAGLNGIGTVPPLNKTY